MSDSTTTDPTLNPQSLLDDASLNESERQFIELFERRATTASVDAVDDVAPASAEEEAEQPASPPGTPADSTAAPVPPTQDQVEGPANDDGGTENESVPLPTGEGESGVDDGASESAPAFTFAGQNYSPDDLARAVQVSAWHQQLSDQQVVAIDALLSGQYRLVPANEATPPSTAPVGSPPATPPASPTADAITDDDAGEWLDPRAQQEIQRLQSELTSLQSSVQQQVSPLIQQQMNESMQQRISAIDSATQSFAKEYALSEEQVSEVLTAATQAQILPALLQRHNNNVADATRAALDMMFWTTPTFREPYVQQRTAADLASLAEQDRAGKVKQQQMTALSASGGSVPRRDPKPTTKDDRHAAMVAEIAAAANGQ